jgi:glycerol-3-phosphate dehydrogenase
VYTKRDLVDSLGIMGDYLYKTYGSRANMIADGDLTQLIGPLTISELKYIIENEMVTSVEDVLVRRTRSAFLLEKEKLFKLIPVVCRMMVESKVVKLEKGETLEGYIEKTAERINGLEFS